MTSLIFGSKTTLSQKAAEMAQTYANTVEAERVRQIVSIRSHCINSLQLKITTGAQEYGLHQISYNLKKAIGEYIDINFNHQYQSNCVIKENNVNIPKFAPLNAHEYQSIVDTVSAFLTKEAFKYTFDEDTFAIMW
jgi:hypothetical protein